MLKKLIGWKGEQIRVKACPFCSGVSSLDVIDSTELFGEENVAEESIRVAVCCDFNKGGCGATGGFRKTLCEATVAWNMRTKK